LLLACHCAVERGRRGDDFEPIVRKLTFTGSTEVGKLLMEQCAGTVKELSLELGDNTPFLAFDHADIEMAVKDAIASKYPMPARPACASTGF
jgi:acyl-CoA reductase-like NAD-dependent aldehyde dehydrogenase